MFLLQIPKLFVLCFQFLNSILKLLLASVIITKLFHLLGGLDQLGAIWILGLDGLFEQPTRLLQLFGPGSVLLRLLLQRLHPLQLHVLSHDHLLLLAKNMLLSFKDFNRALELFDLASR